MRGPSGGDRVRGIADHAYPVSLVSSSGYRLDPHLYRGPELPKVDQEITVEAATGPPRATAGPSKTSRARVTAVDPDGKIPIKAIQLDA
jgi:hypothetical protein